MKLMIVALAALAAAGNDDAQVRFRKVIDSEMAAEWARQQVTPAPRCDDATFVRRVTLDLAGTVPGYEETVAFLKDADPEKRTKLVDRLLEDPRFARTQAIEWDLVLFGRSNGGERAGFLKWMTEKFAKNEPYDKWVRELILAEGNSVEDGAPTFLAQFQGRALDTAESVSKIFLGTQIACARCHDHPFERWLQTDFYGMAAFFARVTVVDGGMVQGQRKWVLAEKSTGDLMFTGSAKDPKPGQKGQPVAAKFLDGNAVAEPPLPAGFKEPDLKGLKGRPAKPHFSRREKFAAWVTASENPYFAKAVVNRVWAQFFSRGFHNPVDNLRFDKPATHPSLFEAMEKHLIARKFDLRWLIREIVASDTYQRDSTGEAVDAKGGYDRYRVRALTPEEAVNAFLVAAGYGESAVDPQKPPAPPSFFERYTSKAFASQSDGRGEFQGSVSERLFMNNGPQIRQLVARKSGNLVDRILKSADPWETRVDRMFLTVLNRPAREEEKKRIVAYVTVGPKPDARVEEALWVLLSTSEFRFNH